jgi:hypothetical protein
MTVIAAVHLIEEQRVKAPQATRQLLRVEEPRILNQQMNQALHARGYSIQRAGPNTKAGVTAVAC